MSVSAKEEAEELLPCCWLVENAAPCSENEPGCAACQKRPAVAAALEARNKRIEELEEANTNQRFNSKRTAQLLVENADDIQYLRVELADCEAQLAALKEG